ncbi:hypothetical protein ACTXT7_007129 [Hymenolepis weldensis]
MQIDVFEYNFPLPFQKLLNKNNGDELAATRKRKEHCQHPVDSLRTPECVKCAWYDGRKSWQIKPYVFQQDSDPSHKALKTQDYMDGREFS